MGGEGAPEGSGLVAPACSPELLSFLGDHSLAYGTEQGIEMARERCLDTDQLLTSGPSRWVMAKCDPCGHTGKVGQWAELAVETDSGDSCQTLGSGVMTKVT